MANTNNNGKLSLSQFSRLCTKLPEIRSQTREVAELAKNNPTKIKEILGSDSSWARIYELDFVQQLAHLFILLEIHEPFINIANSINPFEAIVKLGDDGSDLDKWYEQNKDTVNKKHLIWLLVVLQRNILSIMLFHMPISYLVEKVRNGEDEYFFKAVSIDRSILSCPTFADRLSRAEFMNDKDFFIHLRKSLKGPSKKHMEAIGDLRYSIAVLREMGFSKFTDEELITIFVKTRLYPNNPAAIKNLRKHIQESKKISTT